jgi:hypothetical protein
VEKSFGVTYVTNRGRQRRTHVQQDKDLCYETAVSSVGSVVKVVGLRSGAAKISGHLIGQSPSEMSSDLPP